MRLQKYLASCGVASRRNAEQYILDGRVSVNGEIIRILGTQVDENTDIVQVDGCTVTPEAEKHYLAYNKPVGEVTTVSDPEGRATVMDRFRDYPVRLFPVGRLDYDSEGLLLLTNDGDFANRVMHPSHNVSKTYRTWVEGEDVGSAVEALRAPMEIDGYITSPAEVDFEELIPGGAVLLITIHEGRNRQIRKMCEAAGLKVRRLVRISEGGLELGELKPGTWRYLGEDEIQMFNSARE